MTDKLTIKTDNKWRDLISWFDLPTKDRELFDYIDDDEKHSYRFVKYKGAFYDVCEALRTDYIPADNPCSKWHGIIGESYFSGVLVKYDPEDSRVILASYFC